MREKLTCYIIDDEPLAQEILEAYIGKVEFLELKGVFNSPLEAAAQVDRERPDILFLDINMPDIDGLSFIPMLKYKPMIVLTTAYDQHALKAFDLEVKDYLVKPISFERFYKGVLRLYQDKTENSSVPSVESNLESKVADYLFIKVGHQIKRLELSQILYVEGMKDYLKIHTPTDKIMTLMSFARLEELLPQQNFSRVHRSYMVSIDRIKHIEKNRIWIGESIIPISDSYSAAFYQKLKGI